MLGSGQAGRTIPAFTATAPPAAASPSSSRWCCRRGACLVSTRYPGMALCGVYEGCRGRGSSHGEPRGLWLLGVHHLLWVGWQCGWVVGVHNGHQLRPGLVMLGQVDSRLAAAKRHMWVCCRCCWRGGGQW